MCRCTALKTGFWCHIWKGSSLRLALPEIMVHACLLSCFSRVPLFSTPWTVARQAPLSMGFPRQEYWSVLLFPSPGDLSDPGIEPVSLALAGSFFTTEPWGNFTSLLINPKTIVWTLGCFKNFSLSSFPVHLHEYYKYFKRWQISKWGNVHTG